MTVPEPTEEKRKRSASAQVVPVKSKRARALEQMIKRDSHNGV
jgi:hypothetical protein